MSITKKKCTVCKGSGKYIHDDIRLSITNLSKKIDKLQKQTDKIEQYCFEIMGVVVYIKGG